MDVTKLSSDEFLDIYTRYELMGDKLIIDGMFYKVINDSVFLVSLDNIESIKSMVLVDFITDIDTILFYQTKIKKFVGGSSLRNILDFAFLDSKLETIEFHHEVTLGISAFESCRHLENLINSHLIKSVGSNAFRGTSSLKFLDLSNVEYVSNQAFINSGIESLVINSGVSFVNTSFYGMTELKNVYIKGNRNVELENLFLDYDSNIKIDYIS